MVFNQDDNNENLQPVSESAKLAVIAGVVSTFGDLLSTISAVLAIEEERQAENNKSDNSDNKSMQKQIDYLSSELEKLKKQVNNVNPYFHK